MTGIIQKDGSILGKDKKLYYPMKHYETILIEDTSWARMDIKDIKGKKVEFEISSTGKGYNYKLIE